MDFDGGVLVAEINLVQHAGGLDQTGQLLQQILLEGDMEIGKIYFRWCHRGASSLSVFCVQ